MLWATLVVTKHTTYTNTGNYVLTECPKRQESSINMNVKEIRCDPEGRAW